MLRLIVIVAVFVCVVVGGGAVALYHFFGWKGLVALPFILIGGLWVTKIIIGKLVKRFLLRLFSMKSSVLRGATMTLHSVTAVSKPKPDAGEEVIEVEGADGEVPKAAAESPAQAAEPEEVRHYFAVDMTIRPQDGQKEAHWEPGEFILTSERIKDLADLEDSEKELGRTEMVEVWNGSVFGPNEEGKYPGEQRLKIIFAVKPGTSKAWMHYYDEAVGMLDLPAWQLNGLSMSVTKGVTKSGESQSLISDCP